MNEQDGSSDCEEHICNKTWPQGFRQSETQTNLLSYRDELENLLVAILDMILYNKQTLKVLIRLSGCAGWSAPLLFANPEDRFSHVEAHIFL